MNDDGPDSSRLLQAFTARWLLLLLGVPLTYSIIRYHVFKGVTWSHFPLHIANKAIDTGRSKSSPE